VWNGLCQLASVSRAGYYRSLQEQSPVEEEMAVRSACRKWYWKLDDGTDTGG